ncbi:ABC transporter permease [Bacillus sp. SJS]|uniref:ABC transporter permease n=1 Tax=Bacillus sp. SJS TaxID=1423321 RepID=UPI000824C48E|nr:ABC transporter permease subunit [Bacillus sp. SJS]
MRRLWREKKFVAGFVFLALLLLLSIGNTIFNNGDISQARLSFGEKGTVLAKPPYAPSVQNLLGTDVYGYDMLHIIIQGAKYTIGIALLITIIRMVCSYITGAVISTYFPKGIPLLRVITEPFTIVPQLLIAYFILLNVLWMPDEGFPNPFWERALFEVFILSIIAIPALTLYMADQMRSFWKMDFIESSKTLGGSQTHIFWRHIRPSTFGSSVLLFIQQFIQVLSLLAHLGVLELFFGGTMTDAIMTDPPKTLSYEWSGLIGDSYPLIRYYPWIPLTVIVFFTLTILAVNMMLSSAEKVFNLRQQIPSNDLMLGKSINRKKHKKKQRLRKHAEELIDKG